MATRVFLPSQGAAPVSPAFDAGWTRIDPAVARIQAVTVLSSTPFVTVRSAFSDGTPQHLMRQYVSAPMNAQTISGTMKSILRVMQETFGGSYYSDFPNMSAKVVSRDGTVVRGVLYAITASPSATAIPGVLTNRKFPPAYAGAGVTLSSVVCSQGDRLVFEFGFAEGSNGVPPRVTFEFGDNGSDLVENETGTTQGNGWVELSMNVVWETPGGGTLPGGGADPGAGPAAVPASAVVTLPRLRINWEWFLCDLNGNALQDITDLLPDPEVLVARNSPLRFSDTVPSNHPKIAGLHTDGYPFLKENLRTIKGYRDEGGGTKVLRVNAHIVQPTYVGDKSARTTILAYDPLFRLGRRLCRDTSGNNGISFDSTPAQEIVRLLIDNANRLGPYPTGVQTIGFALPALTARTIAYDGSKTVASAIVDLAQSQNGFDIYMAPIDHTDGYMVRLQLYTPNQGAARPDVALGWQKPPYNLRSIEIPADGGQQRNVVLASGSGATVEVGDPTSKALYGWLEEAASFSDIGDATYLSARGTKALNPNAPLFVNRVDPVPGKVAEPWTHFFIGDGVSVAANLAGGIDTSMTVESFTVRTGRGERLTNLQARQP